MNNLIYFASIIILTTSHVAGRTPVNELVRDSSETTLEHSCGRLFTFKTFQNQQESVQRVPLPIFDGPHEPHTIGIPFKEPGMAFISLRSRKSVNVIRKYYIRSLKCLKTSQKAINIFKSEFYLWLKSQVLPILYDRQWYPAFGGVLSILEELEREGVAGNEHSLREFYKPRVEKENTGVTNNTRKEKCEDGFFKIYVYAISILVVILLILVILGLYIVWRGQKALRINPDLEKGQGGKLLTELIEYLNNYNKMKDKETQVERKSSSSASSMGPEKSISINSIKFPTKARRFASSCIFPKNNPFTTEETETSESDSGESNFVLPGMDY